MQPQLGLTASTVIGGPYLPLTGGTLSGPLSGTSATFAGQVSVAFSNPDVSGIELQATVGTNAAAIKITNTGGNFYIGKDKSDGSRISGTAYANAVWAENANPLVFGVSNSEKMRIDSSGNVTIGSSTLTGPRSLTLLSATNATDYDINFQQAGTTNFGRIRFTEGAADFQFFAQVGQDPNLTLKYGGNSFFSRGNVGIGTDSPGAKLEVVDGNNYAKIGDLQGNSTMLLRMADSSGFPVEVQAYGTELRFNTATTSGATPSVKMNVLANGNVGIGTDAPSQKLQVQTGTDTDGIIITGDGTSMPTGEYRRLGFRYSSTDTSFSSEIRFEVPNGAVHGGAINFMTHRSGSPTFQSNMYLDQYGRVGIGTTSTSKKLTVDGGILVGGNNTDVGASQIYGDIRRPQAVNYCERIWNRNSAATPSTYYIARQWHDSINWAAGHINVIVWGVAPTVSTLFKGDFSCGYGYNNNSIHISTNFNPGNLNAPFWQAPVLVSGNIYYRDLTITIPSYNRYIVQVINPGNLVQTYDINNTGQNKVYFYPQG